MILDYSLDCDEVNNAHFERIGADLNKYAFHKYTVLCVYRPSSSSLTAFNSEFSPIISRYMWSGQDIIGMFSAEGYICLIENPTRVERVSSTCIDHIYVNNPLPYRLSVIISYSEMFLQNSGTKKRKHNGRK